MVLPFALEAPSAVIADRPSPLNYLAPAPAPLDDTPELPRRMYQLGPEVGVALPQCAASSGNGCAALHAGPELALFALVRPAPHFAFGASARRASFSVSPDGAGWQTSATASLFALSARVYALESGRFDPYLELDFGAGTLALEVRGENARREDVALSPALRSALGVDVLLNTWLRCGAFISYSRYFSGSVSACSPLGCSALRVEDSTITVGSIALGLTLGVAAGEML
jgi:hypothetical protein